MFGNAFMPLRNTVGPPLEIVSTRVTDRAPGLQGHEIAVAPVENLATSPLHHLFLPRHLRRTGSSAAYAPGGGVAAFPAPVDLPLASAMLTPGTLFSIVARGPDASRDVSRELWFEVEFTIIKPHRVPGIPVIGGICYSGYPYLPYYITPQGENSANFSLPREIRVAWSSQEQTAFLDDEAAITQQESASHSGVHILATGPVAASHVRVRFADFPRFIQDFRTEDGAATLVESFGVYLPFLFFFAYQEDVRFRPRVPGGLLGAVQVPAKGRHTYLAALNAHSHPLASDVTGVAADYVVTTDDPRAFFPLSGASIFGQRRQYQLQLPGETSAGNHTESFVSQALDRGDQVRLFIAQGEEHNRCLAGLTGTLTAPDLVSQFTGGQRTKVDAKVYELDPIEGVSPVNLATDPATDKYAKLIHHTRELPADAERLACRFVRPVVARYLAIVFTSLDRGHVALDNLELVQSAHVMLASRISRTQRVRSLNFRVIGANLGGDYARLGEQGFTFTIEHLVAGSVKKCSSRRAVSWTYCN